MEVTLYFACCWLFGPRPAALPLRSGVADPRQVERFLILHWDPGTSLVEKEQGISATSSGIQDKTKEILKVLGVSVSEKGVVKKNILIRTAHPT